MAKTFIQRSREKSPAEKATFHALSGAGRSGVIRDFFGLTEAEEAAIEKELDLRLQVNLDRQG